MKKLQAEEDENTVCEERENIAMKPVTSKRVIMTTTRNSSVESDCLSYVSVRRPNVMTTQATKRVLTSTQATSTVQNRIAPASINIFIRKECKSVPC